MRNITLANGDTVSALGLGTWFLGDDRACRQEEIAALRCGIEGGARLIDTAEMYGSGRSEELVGEAITPFPRELLYLITKVLPSNASRRRMEGALDASLARLGTEYVDMYLYHWRGGTPLAETVAELERLRENGKIRSWGVSNFDVEDMEELAALPGGANCQANEVLYHLGSRGIEVELRGLMERLGVALIAYCPLAQAGTLRNGLVTNPVVTEVARDLGVSPFQVLLAWVLAQSPTIAIPRTGKLAHMRENLEAARIELSVEQLARLDGAFPAPHRRVPLDVE
ncbi:aldo/keto reductase [Actinotignum timonense]|uniref:aldo/keto reductase n=1 Tax=Actinotignum timonense TaxID=1870995 RepID=UPI002A816FFE|nr:aldo/keto reductase [Actinotignum timonense]MDY5157522.1 aldo/keto reductase [Actinotignum timonense]